MGEVGVTVCNHWRKKKHGLLKKNSMQLGKSGQPFRRLPLTIIIPAPPLPKPQLFQRKPWAAGTQLPTLDTPASPHFARGILTWPFPAPIQICSQAPTSSLVFDTLSPWHGGTAVEQCAGLCSTMGSRPADGGQQKTARNFPALC